MSESEYRQILARQAARNLSPKSEADPDRYEHESDLHNEILDYCKSNGWLCFHGSTAHRTKRTAGEPDCTVVASGGRTFLVECKIRNRKATTEQLATLALARKLGHKAGIVQSLEEFVGMVNEEGQP